LCSVLNLCHRC